MRITWNKSISLSERDRTAIERALMKRATPATAFVDGSGSFLVCSLDEAPEGDWAPCAASSEGAVQLELPAAQGDDLREQIEDLKAALRDRNEAIDRIVAQRDHAIAELTAANDTIAAYLATTETAPASE